MAETKLQVVIEAVNRADKALNDVQRELKNVAKSQDTVAQSAKRAEKSFGGLTAKIAAGNIIANVATRAFFGIAGALGNFIKDSIGVSLQVERLQATIGALASNTGRTKDEVNSLIQAIRNENKSILEATEITKGIIAAQLDEADALKLLTVARDVGATEGKSSADVNRLILQSVQTLNPAMLNQVGIQLSLREVYKDVAAQLGKNTSELTTVERQQALFNAAMAQGELRAGAYNAAMGTVQKVSKSVKDAFVDVQFVAGELADAGFGEIANAALEAIRTFRAWAITAENQLNPQLKALAADVGVAVITTFRTIVALARILFGAFKALSGSAFDGANIFELVARASQFVGRAFVATANVIGRFQARLTNFFIQWQQGFPALRLAAIQWAEDAVKAAQTVAVALGQSDIISKLGGLTNKFITMRGAVAAAKKNISAASVSFTDLKASTFGLDESLEDIRARILSATTGLMTGFDAAAASGFVASEAFDRTADSSKKADKAASDALKNQQSLLKTLSQLWDDYITQVETFDVTTEQGFANFATVMSDTSVGIERFSTVFRENFDGIKKSMESNIRETQQGIEDLTRSIENASNEIVRLTDRRVESQLQSERRLQETVASLVIKSEQDLASLQERLTSAQSALDAKVAAQKEKFAATNAKEQAKLVGLQEALATSTADTWRQTNLLAAIEKKRALITAAEADQQEKIQDIRDMASTGIDKIQEEIDVKNEILTRSAELEQGFIAAIEQARADAGMNELDRMITIAERRQSDADSEIARQLGVVQSRLAGFQAERDNQNMILDGMEKRRKETEASITELLRENLALRLGQLENNFTREAAAIEDLKSKWVSLGSTIRSALATARAPQAGGGFAIPTLAAGGIVTRPTLALIGEAGPEAVVPLRRGGMGVGGGGMGGGVTVIINGTVISDNPERVAQRIGDAIFRQVNRNMRI